MASTREGACNVEAKSIPISVKRPSINTKRRNRERRKNEKDIMLFTRDGIFDGPNINHEYPIVNFFFDGNTMLFF